MDWPLVGFWALLVVVASVFLWFVIFRPAQKKTEKQNPEELRTDVPHPPD
jgi:preprotein translocase subunit YajC